MRVGVLFGGCSSEKEVSLESGRHTYNSLDREKYEVTPIFVDSQLRFWKIPEHLVWMNSTADIERSLEGNADRIYYEELNGLVDFAFLGLHGKFVEDGSLQGLLEMLDLPYNGPRVLGAALGMDKVFQKNMLRAAGIPYTPNVAITAEEYREDPKKVIAKVEKAFSYPLVIKPSREGCSTGLAKVKAPEQLAPAIEEALRWDNAIMAEKFMPMMEVTCTVLGNQNPKALLPTETPTKNDFLTVEEKFLFGDAQMFTPPRVPAEDVKAMQATFEAAYKAMNLQVYTRIDGFWDADEKVLYINEPNTLPGITPSTHVFHQAAEAGMSASDFFDKIIELSLEAHELHHGAPAYQEQKIANQR